MYGNIYRGVDEDVQVCGVHMKVYAQVYGCMFLGESVDGEGLWVV